MTEKIIEENTNVTETLEKDPFDMKMITQATVLNIAPVITVKLDKITEENMAMFQKLSVEILSIIRQLADQATKEANEK